VPQRAIEAMAAQPTASSPGGLASKEPPAAEWSKSDGVIVKNGKYYDKYSYRNTCFIALNWPP
jgi:hypothetical protein